MAKVRYAGNGAQAGSIPPQPEAAAYFARMTVSPNPAFRQAVNLAIYKWKAQGNWSLLKGLWLFCADTSQAALLSVIGDTPRDATITGSLTFTAAKGFSGFSSANVLNFGGISSGILVDDDFYGFLGCTLDGTVGAGALTRSDAGSSSLIPGVFTIDGSGFVRGGASGNLCAGGLSNVNEGFVGGVRLSRTIMQSTIGSVTGSDAGRSSNYRTNDVNGGPLTRMIAVGYLGSGASNVQCRKFLSTLTELINDVGALD